KLKCDELEKQKKDSDSHCAALEKEKKDIVDYLKHSVLEKEDEAQELSERLESQRQASDQAREALRLQHERLRQELRARIEELTGENGTLATRLAVLEEFQEQKEQLMSNMASLEKQLVSLKEEHKADVHSLEMKALLEKRRLKEMESHAAATAAQLGHLVDQRVPEATRRALRENAEASARCGQLSEQAHALMKENAALRDRKSQLAVDVDILEQMLGELSRKSCVRKKVMEQLTEKCRQLQTELELCRQEHRQLHAKHKLALARTETLRFTEFIEFIRSYRALDSSYPRSRSFKGVQGK
uniref:Cilia- and flagella-associated protein 157 n=1 Tax=Scophthalmus maximus TaxID=52904 RepID=A0A8D3C012_SCOMX